MKFAVLLVAALSFLVAGETFAHGPSRQKVVEKIEIGAEPTAVWGIIKDFSAIKNWLPGVTEVTATGGNEPGATRTLTLQNGGILKEELKKYEPDSMSYSYKITDILPEPKVFPVNTYSAMITVSANPAGGSVVEWSGAFYRGFMNNNPPPELSDEAAVKAVTDVFKAGLANIKALAEKK